MQAPLAYRHPAVASAALAAAAMDAAFLAPLKPVTRLALGMHYGLPPAAVEQAREILARMPAGDHADAASDVQRRDFLLISGWSPSAATRLPAAARPAPASARR